MTARTPEQAAGLLCPYARTFAPKAEPHCQGPSCAVWRWQPLPASILASPVKERMASTKEGHKEAVAWVMDNRESLGIPTEPTHGYCGAGGQP